METLKILLLVLTAAVIGLPLTAFAILIKDKIQTFFAERKEAKQTPVSALMDEMTDAMDETTV